MIVVTCDKCGPLAAHDPVNLGIRRVQLRLPGFPNGIRGGPQYAKEVSNWCKSCRTKYKSVWRHAK